MEKQIFTSVPLPELIKLIADEVSKVLRTGTISNKKDLLLTRQQTAAILQVSLPTLNIWTKRGIIQAKRINSRVRYSEADVYSALHSYNKYGRAAL